jgi:hypothetical protein
MEYAEAIWERRGNPYWAVVHVPDAEGDRRNFHCHVVWSDRVGERDEDGEWVFERRKLQLEWPWGTERPQARLRRLLGLAARMAPHGDAPGHMAPHGDAARRMAPQGDASRRIATHGNAPAGRDQSNTSGKRGRPSLTGERLGAASAEVEAWIAAPGARVSEAVGGQVTRQLTGRNQKMECGRGAFGRHRCLAPMESGALIHRHLAGC